MRIGIMQPYFFPYIGYFELINLVDLFVFYDDAAFSKNSWYNRNRIASINKDFEYIRVSVAKAPLGTPLNDIVLTAKKADFERSLAILNVYSKLPNYNDVKSIVSKTFEHSGESLGDIASRSVIESCNHLGLTKEFLFSSSIDYDRSAQPVDKVLEICRAVGATEYINLSGGAELYDREIFSKQGIKLSFSLPSAFSYSTGSLPFVQNLSIVDSLMHCSNHQVTDYLQSRGSS